MATGKVFVGLLISGQAEDSKGTAKAEQESSKHSSQTSRGNPRVCDGILTIRGICTCF